MLTTGLIGRKLGNTRIFNKENGDSIPVTVIELQPNRVTQIKTVKTDGYNALQVTTGEKKLSRLTKALAGHFKKGSVLPGDVLVEFNLLDPSKIESVALGTLLNVADTFKSGQIVDVTGTSKGKGFAGAIKRWNFKSQRASHGNSLSHRAPGSIGQNQSPGKVFKGKKMAGHLGCETVTIQNLEVVEIDAEKHLILIKGAVPGATGSYVVVRHACKKQKNVGVA